MLPTHLTSVILSIWQSAVATRARPPDPASASLDRPLVSFGEPRVLAANQAALAEDARRRGEEPGFRAHPLFEVAKAALDLGLALVDGDPGKVIAAKAAFMALDTPDPFWLECITEFVEHYTLTRHAAVPYVKWRDLSDGVLPSGTLPDRCRVAVLSDWGTGDARAQALIEDVGRHRPEIVIHLGDIYYACTAVEANAFHANMTRGLGPDIPRLFTLCGNHDMYGGAAPYYALLGRIGQPSSYFCLRNAHWQILAADTGYNDFNPFKHDDDQPWIRDRDDGEDYSELDWHRDKLATAEGRRTILMSHHPLFSRNSTIAGGVFNGRLQAQLAPHLAGLAAWFWGHEHTMAVYEPFLGLAKGRCVGAGAVPVSSREDLASAAPEHAGKAAPDLVRRTGVPVTLGPERDGDLYRLGYALLDFDGAACAASYVEFDPSTDDSVILFAEML